MPGSELSSADRQLDRVGRRPALSRYDLVLAVIPVAFLAALVPSGVAGLPTYLTAAAAGLVGAVALADGLFLNPPRRPRVGDRAA